MISALIIAAAVLPPVAAALGFYWGYTFAVRRYFLGDINQYLKTKFPTEWAAYKRGVDEGYTQGLRDGQEMPT